MKRLKVAAWAIAVAGGVEVFFCAASARAVIVDGSNGQGTANTTAPFPISQLQNVGVINAGSGVSAVYIGNGWGLTAAHVSPSFVGFTFTVAGQPYTINSYQQLDNSGVMNADLIEFHLSTTPSISGLALSTTTPANGTPIYSMGDGLSRSATMTLQSDGNEAYTETDPQVLRWGTNITSTYNDSTTYTFSSGGLVATTFISSFDAPGSGGTSSEMELSGGDSGGAAFSSTGTLIGINEGEGVGDNQPANTAEYGDLSFYTDIATYESQIAAIEATPEPGPAALLALVIPLALLRRRRRGFPMS